MSIYRYALWVKGPDPELTQCGEFVIEEAENLQIRKVAFRYTPNYLAETWAYPLDPGRLPLAGGTFTFEPTGKNLPGFLDDLMPDQWGTNLLTRYLRSVQGIDFNPHSRCQILNNLPDAFVGALKATAIGEDRDQPPVAPGLGLAIEQLVELGDPDQVLRQPSDSELQRYGIARLAQGSSVGGARPKVLCFDTDNAYIAKFRREGDVFNMVRVEAACLEMIRKAGFSAAEASVEAAGDGREALMVRRFDLGDGGQRHHLMTANALLKQKSGCEDAVFPDYTDLVDLIRRYSADPGDDLKQLFAQMLFNEHLNNRDDHLRNFSFVHGPQGLRLAPAYDVVPSHVAGAYPALGYKGGSRLPDCDRAADAARAFHLTRNEATCIAQAVRGVLNHWRDTMRAFGVEERDLGTLAHALGEPS